MKTDTKLIESIKLKLKALKEDPSPEMVKKIVCPFYQKGGASKCNGCLQDTDVLRECKGDYKAKIESRPMDTWEPSFDALEVRKKIKLSAIGGLDLRCDKCYIGKECPVYKPRSTCAIDWGMGVNMKDPKAIYDRLIRMQNERIQKASLMEKMDGGVPDQNLSTEIDRLGKLMAAKASLDVSKFSLQVDAKASGQGGGVLAKIFGDALGGKKQEALPEKEVTIDIPAEDVTEIKEPIKRRKTKNTKDEKENSK